MNLRSRLQSTLKKIEQIRIEGLFSIERVFYIALLFIFMSFRYLWLLYVLQNAFSMTTFIVYVCVWDSVYLQHKMKVNNAAIRIVYIFLTSAANNYR